MFKRKLVCSFCGKGETEVAKLVAGPRVHICDVCAAEAHRIMSDPTIGAGTAHSSPDIWTRVRTWFAGHLRATESPA